LAQPIDVEGFIAAHGFVTFHVDQGTELGAVTFSGPDDREPTWSGVISERTLGAVVERFHDLGQETRERLFRLPQDRQ
jgi:hypothetical protein